MLLLHGLGDDSSFWSASVPALGDAFRVVTVDLPGSGRTPVTEPSVAAFADEVLGALDEAGVPTAHVVGFALGGMVAQYLAARHADHVDRLVLASSFSTLNAQAGLFLDAVRDVVVATGSLRAVGPLVRPWQHSIDHLAGTSADGGPSVDGGPGDVDPAGWLAQQQAQRDFNGRATMALISAPTLVLSGAEDRLAPPTDAAELAAGIPAASLTAYPDAGHLLPVEVPDRFTADVRAFLSS